MKELHIEIRERLMAEVKGLKRVLIWNSQFAGLEEGKTWDIPLPAVFVEYVPIEINTAGPYDEVFELEVTIHLAHEFLHSPKQMDENLDVFDYRTKIYKALKRWAPTAGSSFFRIRETQDDQHSNLYHYEMTFRTTWVDQTANPEYVERKIDYALGTVGIEEKNEDIS